MRTLALYSLTALKAVVAAMLLGMVVLVFGNVVLRYGFNTGITISEELSRWLFVWLIFLGAVIALAEKEHLGVTFVVDALPPVARKAALVLGHLIMMAITIMLAIGSWQQAMINWTVLSPVMRQSSAILFIAPVFFAVPTLLILSVQLWQIVAGRFDDDR